MSEQHPFEQLVENSVRRVVRDELRRAMVTLWGELVDGESAKPEAEPEYLSTETKREVAETKARNAGYQRGYRAKKDSTGTKLTEEQREKKRAYQREWARKKNAAKKNKACLPAEKTNPQAKEILRQIANTRSADEA